MDANKEKALREKIKETIRNLERNNIKAVFVYTKEEALTLVKSLVPSGSYTATGGSMTLMETGITDYLKNETEWHQDYRDAYSASFYLASCNAITTHGEIYEVDGRGNRVSAILFGPEKVILVAGINKLVPSLRDAVERVKNEACPPNCVRLSKDTPCSRMGHCVSPYADSDHLFALGCADDETICCSAVALRRQREKDRITVIIVGEELGY